MMPSQLVSTCAETDAQAEEWTRVYVCMIVCIGTRMGMRVHTCIETMHVCMGIRVIKLIDMCTGMCVM